MEYRKQQGEAVSFIGGDDIADKDWIKNIRIALKNADIIAGKLIALKHGDIWDKHSGSDMLKTQTTIWGYIRLAVGLLGYIYCVITIGKYKK